MVPLDSIRYARVQGVCSLTHHRSPLWLSATCSISMMRSPLQRAIMFVDPHTDSSAPVRPGRQILICTAPLHQTDV